MGAQPGFTRPSLRARPRARWHLFRARPRARWRLFRARSRARWRQLRARGDRLSRITRLYDAGKRDKALRLVRGLLEPRVRLRRIRHDERSQALLYAGVLHSDKSMAIWDQAKQLHARGQRGEARRLARQAISHRRQARRRFAELVEREPSFQVSGGAAPHIKRDFSHAWYNPTGYLKPSTEGIRARGSRLASLGNLLRRGGRAASRGAAGLARLYHFLRGDVGKNAAHASKSVVQIDLGNSSGSGLVYRSLTEPNKNLILTNQHVVGSLRKGDMVSVGLARGGRPIAARVRGMSVLADVAVLEPVDPLPRGIRPLRFRRRPVHKGDPVAVVGHPYGGQGDGVDPQVSAGVVSQARPGNLTITDTKTGSGGSGGPVVDRRGRVIGLLTAVRGPKTPQQHGSAYPLIVPNARIMQVLRKVERGVVRHASSGLLVDGLQVAEAHFFNKRTNQAVVRDLVAGSPAHRAGLKPGDVILGVTCASTGDKMLRNPTPGALNSIDLALRPSERVTYEVQRGDRSMRFTTSAVSIERLAGNPFVEAGGGQKQLSLFE